MDEFLFTVGWFVSNSISEIKILSVRRYVASRIRLDFMGPERFHSSLWTVSGIELSSFTNTCQEFHLSVRALHYA